jgi:hypothetical protein
MSGDHLHQQGRPRAPQPQRVAAALLVVSAALAAGGSFGAFFTRRSTYEGKTSTLTVNGWGYSVTPPPQTPPGAATSFPGIPIAVAAAVALVAALVLLLRARPADGPRLLAIVGAGLIVGGIAPVIADVAAATVNAGVNSAAGNEQSVAPGLGTWLLTVAALGALVVVALLVVPARSPGVPLPALPAHVPLGQGYPPPYPPGPPGRPGQAPQAPPHPYGPAPHAPPHWQGPPPGWSPSGPAEGPHRGA